MSDLVSQFHPQSDDDKNAELAARNLRSILQSISASCINEAAKNPVHALLILTQAANGLLHLLARQVMRDGDNQSTPISATATMFAALASYQVAPCEDGSGHLVCEFSPLVLFDVLKSMEKLNGKTPDDALDETMCRVARECGNDPAVVAFINSQRANTMRGGATLN